MEENNTKDKKTTIAIIVLAVICILVVAPVAWFAGKEAAKKDAPTETKEKQTEKKEDTKEEEEEPKDQKEDEPKETESKETETFEEEIVDIEVDEAKPETKKYTIQKVAYESKDPEGNLILKVELTTTGEALLSYYDGEEKLENIKIAEDVVLVQGVHVGMSDICAGNARVIFIHKNTSISSLNVDQLECGNTISITKNVAGLKNIVEIKEITNHSGSPYEPNNYTVYAVDSNGKEHNLNEALN